MASNPSMMVEVRSEPVRRRFEQIERDTGLTPPEIVEQAVLAFEPPIAGVSSRLVREGNLLVFTGGLPITHGEVQASIDEDREARGSCY